MIDSPRSSLAPRSKQMIADQSIISQINKPTDQIITSRKLSHHYYKTPIELCEKQDEADSNSIDPRRKETTHFTRQNDDLRQELLSPRDLPDFSSRPSRHRCPRLPQNASFQELLCEHRSGMVGRVRDQLRFRVNESNVPGSQTPSASLSMTARLRIRPPRTGEKSGHVMCPPIPLSSKLN